MLNVKNILLYLIALSLCSGLFAQENYKVRDLEIDGNETLSEKKLLEQMATVGVSFLEEYILGVEPYYYSSDIMNADLERLNNLYRREGFMDAAVTLDRLEADNEDETVEVYVSIQEGPPFLIDSVYFNMTGDSMRADSLIRENRDDLVAGEGARFRDADIDRDKGRIKTWLANNGYAAATVDYVLFPDRERRRVRVAWNVSTGPIYRFGEITIEGNERIPDALITKQLVLEPGERYNRSLIEKSQEQVYQLGVFSVASIRELPDSTNKLRVPVEISIREAPQWRSKLGVGYGREDDFRVFSDLRYLGFFGGARRLDIYLKHSGLEPYHIDLKMTRPAFFTPRTNLVYNAFALRQEEPGFRLNRTGGSAGLVHRFTNRFSISSSYLFEQVDLDTTSLAIVEQNRVGSTPLYNKSSIIAGVDFNDATPLVSPVRGIKLSAVVKLSGLGLGSSYDFRRLMTDLRYYRPLNGAVLAMRLKAGAIVSGDPGGFVPVEDRFFSGGSQSVRGWLRGKLGPLSQEGVPVGGKSLLEFSAEYRFPVYSIVSAVAFLDGGNVWSKSLTWPAAELRYAAGGGLRVESPIGPVRLDLARPVWDERRHWQVHISVGQAF